MYVFVGNGFITTEVLREILRELDENLTEDDLDNMIDEIDMDGSGTVDWEGNYHCWELSVCIKKIFYF